jgi:cytoskeletal protein RodZ
MNDFVSKNILHNNELIAEALRVARTAKMISLDKAAQKIDINKKYLIALETGKFNQLPAGVYAKNFLKEYAIFLGLDANELLALYTEENSNSSDSKFSQVFSRRAAKLHYAFNFPRLLKGLLIALAVSFCLFYLVFSLKKIVAAPYLTISQPAENLTTKENLVNIIGATEPGTAVKVNSEDVMVAGDGSFSKEVNLKNGLNTLTIEAQKKYSKKSEIIRKIFVE